MVQIFQKFAFCPLRCTNIIAELLQFYSLTVMGWQIQCTSSLSTHWLPVYEYIVLGNQGKTRDISVDLPTA